MPETFKHTFDTPVYKGTVEIPTGIFIDGKFIDGAEGGYIE
jgi:aldehyde dehydrogenase (NAD+)